MNADTDKRKAWFSRFHAVLDAEADQVDSYLLTKDPGGLYPVDSHCAEDVLAAGLSERPGRFPSRAAAREWFPAIMDNERRPEQAFAFNAEDDPWKHFSSAEWRALQCAELHTLLDRLDSSDMIYELGITDDGYLAICPFDTNRFADELSAFGDARSDDSWKQLDAFNDFNKALQAEADWVDGYAVIPDPEVDLGPSVVAVARTPDAILSAGLSPRPGRFPTRAAALEWYPAPRNDRRPPRRDTSQAARDAFRAAHAQHGPHFTSPAWRELQRQALQDMIDRTDEMYELQLDVLGNLVVRRLPSDKFADETGREDQAERKRVRTKFLMDMCSPYVSSYPEYFDSVNKPPRRRIKRGDGGRGPYDPADIIAAGLTGHPGYRLSAQGQPGWRLREEEGHVVARLKEAVVVRESLPAPDSAQFVSLVRLIASLDDIGEPYALALDENDALAVRLLEEPNWDAYNIYEDSLIRRAWDERFHIALDTEQDWLDAYLLYPGYDGAGLRSIAGKRPGDVFAAGLTERPHRFASHAAEREWHPSIPPMAMEDILRSIEERRAGGDAARLCNACDYSSDEWRALQRRKLQEMLNVVDGKEIQYELIVVSGSLSFCLLGNRDGGGRAMNEREDLYYREDFYALTYSSYFAIYGSSSGCEYWGRRVKRGVRGRGRDSTTQEDDSTAETCSRG
ncbi:uncharacterized protein LOC62_05G007736 [Vanrija pseudolonga]|uniref:Uncharacterized protein n=1 Tax=Vanrija pseudolonga TaxID=143232 RepID=A0AAF0YCI8_9TREE|nr:hypothetical protein LOC62_05G007736 [Vanrija pseudolonga]